MTPTTEFDDWLSTRFEAGGSFTVLIVLVSIGDRSVDLLRSTHLHVIGTEIDWLELTALLDGARVAWNGVALFIVEPDGGLVPDDVAKRALADLTTRLHADRLVLNEGWFFDRSGRKLQIEEVASTH